MSNSLVTVIIPAYNHEKYVQETINSIIAQTYQNIELVIIDDGSVDDSYSLLKKYVDKYSWVKLISLENSGQGVARNVGIDSAVGKYVMFLDMDDSYFNNAFEKLYEVMHGSDVDVAFFDYCIVQNESSVRANIFKDLAPSNIAFSCMLSDVPECVNFSRECWYKIYKRDFLIKNNIKFLDTKMWEDFYFWHSVIVANPKVCFFNEPLYNYIQHKITARTYSGLYFEELFVSFSKSIDLFLKSNLSQDFKIALLHSDINWLIGWCNRFDKKTFNKTNKFKRTLFAKYSKQLKLHPELALYSSIFNCYLPNPLKDFFQLIFSIKNNMNYKILTIFGHRFKLYRKNN